VKEALIKKAGVESEVSRGEDNEIQRMDERKRRVRPVRPVLIRPGGDMGKKNRS
jgi:hypothetical protein